MTSHACVSLYARSSLIVFVNVVRMCSTIDETSKRFLLRHFINAYSFREVRFCRDRPFKPSPGRLPFAMTFCPFPHSSAGAPGSGKKPPGQQALTASNKKQGKADDF